METPPPLPNPLTPLAWLPSDIASQLEASRYLYSATVGAWVWDTLMSIPEDVLMFRDHPMRIADVVYILARFASFGFIIASLIFQVASVGDCHKLAQAIGWLGACALPLNSLLFFFRARAVFNKNKILVALFAVLWLGTLGGSLTAPFAVDGIHIGTTSNCVNSNVKPFASAGSIAVAVNDTLVFLAISTQLMMYSLASTWSSRIKAFMKGQGLGQISKTLLQTGQLYYMATVGLNLVAAIVILTPSVPPVLRAMFSIPNVALQNVMACRVYRQLKIGLIREQPQPVVLTSRGTMQFSRTAVASKANSQSQVESHISLHNLSGPGGRAKTLGVPVHVDIDREVEVSVDEVPSLHSSKSGLTWKGSDMA
ncbi:hypothetical protein EIP91_000816 [Steccherinum ochraceum]|uniref:Transmembrane protein n=1 Tax=Steccherinum ochraceum TaxID=92696 RepID=A0A4R0RIE2_9APHY|nr:hypothetical protein EIP91_000816 [Steccherinum ochraceum]